jgi:hypothetical protein
MKKVSELIIRASGSDLPVLLAWENPVRAKNLRPGLSTMKAAEAATRLFILTAGIFRRVY